MSSHDDEIILASFPGSRRKSREIALHILYAAEITQDPIQDVIKMTFDRYEDEETVLQFARTIIEQTHRERQKIDRYIRDISANWRFERIATIDLIIMRIAINEFLNCFDIPPKVSIDEALELSKIYSTEKSSGFINGILDAVLERLENENQVVKTGRGRLDHERPPDHPA